MEGSWGCPIPRIDRKKYGILFWKTSCSLSFSLFFGCLENIRNDTIYVGLFAEPRKNVSRRIVPLIHDQIMDLPSIFNGLGQAVTHFLSSSPIEGEGVGSVLANTILADSIKLGGKKLLHPYLNQPDKLEEILDEIRKSGTIKDYSGGYKQFRQEVQKACEEMVQEEESFCLEHPDEMTEEIRYCIALLQSERFQNLLAEWIAGVKPNERDKIKALLIREMEQGMARGGTDKELLSKLASQFFDTLDQEIKSHQDWRIWRGALQRDYLVGISENTNVSVQKIGEDVKKIIDSQKKNNTDKELKAQKLLECYHQKLLETCKNISSPISMSLEDFYVSLPLVEGPPSSIKKKVSIGDLIQQTSCLVILGNSGTGKSTLLNWLAYTNLGQAKDFPGGVVLIRCRELDKYVQQSNIENILESDFRQPGKSFSSDEAKIMAASIYNKLQTDRMFFLIDGLDELENDRETRRKFFEHILELSQKFPHLKIILTSRPEAYREIYSVTRSDLCSHVKEVEFQGLEFEDKERLINAWVKSAYADDSDNKKQKHVQTLCHLLEKNPEADRMTETPLMFSFLLLIFQEKGAHLPRTQAELYEAAVSHLLKHRSHTTDDDLDEKELRLQLEYLALEMSRKRAIQLSELEIIQILRQFRKKLDQNDNPVIEYINKHKEITVFLSLLNHHSGLLVSHGNKERIWEFRHLAYQEYFAACAIVDGYYWEDSKLVMFSEILKEHLTIQKIINQSETWTRIIIISYLLYEESEEKKKATELLFSLFLKNEIHFFNKLELMDCILATIEKYKELRNIVYQSIIQNKYTINLNINDYFDYSNGNYLYYYFEIVCLKFGLNKKSNNLILNKLNEFVCNEIYHDFYSIPDLCFSFLFKILNVSIWNDFCIENISSAHNFYYDNSPIKKIIGIIVNSGNRNRDHTPQLISNICKSSTLIKRSINYISLKDKDDDFCIIIIRILGETGSEKNIHYLLKIFKEKNNRVRLNIVKTIGKIATKNSTKILDNLLDNEDNLEIRLEIIKAIGKIASEGSNSTLKYLLDNEDNLEIRLEIIRALGGIGSKQSIEFLIDLYENDKKVREDIIETLMEINSDLASQALNDILEKENDSEMRKKIIQTFEDFEKKCSVKTLCNILEKEERDDIKDDIIWALGEIGSEIAITTLVRLFEKDETKRETIIWTLGKISSQKSVDVLSNIFQNERNKKMRMEIIRSLGMIGLEQSIKNLNDFLENETDDEIRTEINRYSQNFNAKSFVKNSDYSRKNEEKKLGKPMLSGKTINRWMEYFKNDREMTYGYVVSLVKSGVFLRLRSAYDYDDELWCRVVPMMVNDLPDKIRGEYSFLVREFRPEEEWNEIEEIEKERWRAIKKRRTNMLKEMMHSEVWEEREKAADVLSAILEVISPEEEEEMCLESR